MASVVGATASDFRVEIAEAYKRAALSTANMHSAVNALESIRSALVGRHTGLRALDAIDTEVARSEDPALVEVLAALRIELKRTIFAEQRAALEEIAAFEPERATAEWLRAYGAAYRFGRGEVCENVCAASVELDADLPPRAQFARWTRYAADERWPEVMPMFMLLAEREELDADLRARLLIEAAKVQMYHLLDLDAAAALLDRAESVAPDLPLALIARGELANARDDTATGEELLRRALDTAERYDACNMLGDAANKAEDTAASERWYNEALAESPGNSSAYIRLAWLYFERGGLTERTRIVSIGERAALVDPFSAYSVYVNLGDIFDTGGDSDAAQTWFERAVQLAPDRIRAFVTRGYGHGRWGRYREGEQDFATVVRLADESFDGYWGMGWLLEQAGRYADAEANYRQALERRPEWRPTIEACIARMQRLLGRLDNAERLALDALEQAPASDELLSELHLLVDELSERRGETRRALAILDRIRALRGDSYEANYQNRVGTVHYYYGNYAAAAEAFQRSLDAQTSDAVVWRNLANAHRELGEWDAADREAARAHELDANDDEYNVARALTLNKRANQLFDESRYDDACELYGQAAELAPADAVIHSNCANAAAQIYRPGHRAETLARARAALSKAIELDPDDAYRDRLAQLDFEARLVDAVGEPQIIEGTVPRVIAIELASDLVPQILVPGEQTLKPETLALIEALRTRVHRDCGLVVPGLTFAEDNAAPEGRYALYFLEHSDSIGWTTASGRIFAGPAAELERLGVAGEPLTLAWTDATAYALDDAAARVAEASGLELWTPIEVPLRHLEHAIEQKLAPTTV